MVGCATKASLCNSGFSNPSPDLAILAILVLPFLHQKNSIITTTKRSRSPPIPAAAPMPALELVARPPEGSFPEERLVKAVALGVEETVTVLDASDNVGLDEVGVE